ncbi:MAG: ZIP family metal transporter [Candidatus Ranarchaeia archaeon]
MIINLHPIVQALIGGCFTWGVTALGASMVFLKKQMNRRFLDSMLGFSAGVMIAASFWSLLVPAIDLSEAQNVPVWLPTTVGFLLGGVSLILIEQTIYARYRAFPNRRLESKKTSTHRMNMLICAITLHNIPEGLAIGVAFGAIAAGFPTATFAGAVGLALGIGIQNFPEGLAVSVPLRGQGKTRLESFGYGQLSAIVEPMFAVVGAAAVIIFSSILPYALAFAAGAMIFVVIKEIVPESQSNGNATIGTIGTMLGFVVMMILDITFV